MKFILISVVAITATLGLILTFSSDTQNALFEMAMEKGAEKAGMVKHVIKIDNHDLVYLERPTKQDDAEVIILLHGFTADKNNWLRFTQNVAPEYRVIAIDWPAHGESTYTEKADYTLITQANRLKMILESLNIEKAHVVGNSMGGAIAAIFASYYPEKARTLTLMNSGGADNPNTFSDLEKGLKEGKNLLVVEKPEDFEKAFEFGMSKPPSIPWFLKSAMAEKAVQRSERFKYVFEQVHTGISGKGTDYLTRIQAPTLIMWGDEDHILDVGNASIFDQTIPNSQVLIYKGIGHLPMLEAPQQAAHDIVSFISQY